MTQHRSMFWLLVLATLMALIRPSVQQLTCSITSTFDPSKNYFPAGQQMSIKYAQKFSVSYSNSYKILTVGSSTYVLYMCNGPAPNSTSIPANAVKIPVPVSTAAVADQSVLAALQRLGLLTSVSYVQNLNAITLPCAEARSSSSNILELPTTPVSNIGVVFGNVSNISLSSGTVPITASLMSETSPLARAEWIKFIAAFYNQEALAETTFSGIESTYQCNVAAFQILQTSDRPAVTWITTIDGSHWGDYNPQYAASLINSSGGNYVSMGASLGHADVVKFLQTVDVVIDATPVNPNGVSNIQTFYQNYNITPLDMESFRWTGLQGFVLRTDENVNSNGYDDWPNSAVFQPDYYQMDLIHNLNPKYNSTFKDVWFRNIAQGDGTVAASPKSCADPTAILSVPSTLCPVGATANIQKWTDVAHTGAVSSPPTFEIVPDPSGALRNVLLVVFTTLIALGVAGYFIIKYRKYLSERWYKFTDDTPVYPSNVRDPERFDSRAEIITMTRF